MGKGLYKAGKDLHRTRNHNINMTNQRERTNKQTKSGQNSGREHTQRKPKPSHRTTKTNIVQPKQTSHNQNKQEETRAEEPPTRADIRKGKRRVIVGDVVARPRWFITICLRLARLHRFLLLVPAIPISLHRRSCSFSMGTLQEVEHRRAAPLIRQQVADAPLPLRPLGRLFDPRPQHGMLDFPPVTVLE